MGKYFLDSAAILQKNDMLNYLTYENINEENRELIQTNNWDFEFITKPAAVFFPGNDLLKRRLTSVSLNAGGAVGNIETKVRGFQIYQAAGVTPNGSVSLSFIDKEDQAVSMFLHDWQQKITDLDTKFQYRKEDTACTCRLIQLNTSRIPIAKWTLKTCQPTQTVIQRQFTDEPQNGGEMTIELNFEHMTLEWKNIDN